MASWSALQQELSLWHQAGRSATFWWRDDDAERDTPALQMLNNLSQRYAVPLQLAVIPSGADSSLCPHFAANSELYALQHGFSHSNHAPADQRKCELGDHRLPEQVTDELNRGRISLQSLLGGAFIPALVPPWNRLSDQLPPLLFDYGFCGLSTLGPRPQAQAYQLSIVNVHVDIIDWKQRRFAGEERALKQLVDHLADRRQGLVDGEEATGLMTHHLAHDQQCWDFIERLLEFCDRQPVRWLSAPQLFSAPATGQSG